MRLAWNATARLPLPLHLEMAQDPKRVSPGQQRMGNAKVRYCFPISPMSRLFLSDYTPPVHVTDVCFTTARYGH